MDGWLSILAITITYVVFVLIPGPNFSITIKNALEHSRRSGLYTAAGIACGTLIHVGAGLIGLGLRVAMARL